MVDGNVVYENIERIYDSVEQRHKRLLSHAILFCTAKSESVLIPFYFENLPMIYGLCGIRITLSFAAKK